MKNKYILTAKYALASLLLGLSGLIGVVAINRAPVASATDVVLSLTIQAVALDLSVNSPADHEVVGSSFSLNVSGSNVGSVDVYVDLNKNGTYDSGELLGTFTVAEAAAFTNKVIGPVNIPAGTANGTYNLKAVAHRMNGGPSETDVVVPIELATSQAPQISQIVPNFGPIAGGTDITIRGQRFEAGSKVFIGGNECENLVIVSDTEITCTTPAGTAGRAAVMITGPNGTYTDANGFLYVDYSGGGGGTTPGGPGAIGLPSTGLFRIGDTVVMSKDVAIIILAGAVIVLSVLLVKKNKKPSRAKKSSARGRSQKYSNLRI